MAENITKEVPDLVSDMGKNRLKEAIQKDALALGMFLRVPNAALVEIIGYAGFDFVIIDIQHGPYGIETAENLVRAADAVNITPVIRVPENNPSIIMKALDVGAKGVVVPHITSREDAVGAVQASKYPPDGGRGASTCVRGTKYSAINWDSYCKQANDETMVFIMMEEKEAVANAEEIVSIKGIDVVHIGPVDLSQSLGLYGQFEHPYLEEQMQEVVNVCKKVGVAAAMPVLTVDTAKKWIEKGVRIISFGADTIIFYQTCRDIVKRLSKMIR